GWKLSEEEACREDLTRLCPRHTWANNLAVLECMQDRREETDIAPDCNHLLWSYKLNLTTDPKFESVATEVCKSTIAEIKECNEEERGRGYLVSCLVDHRGNISEYQCNQYIAKMAGIIFSDYKLICGFTDKCKEDINNLRCGSINVGHKDVHSQGEVISCLEKALVKEAEQQDPGRSIKEECQKAILRVAELSSDDFHLDRHLYFSCRDDRERFCQNVQAGEGKVYKCLFNHKFEEAMSEKVSGLKPNPNPNPNPAPGLDSPPLPPQCRDALTVRQKLISQDYRVSYSLAKACKLDLRKQRCSLDTSLPRAREARLSYLLLCLEAAVHRGRSVSGECQGEMLDYRRMLMEDFSLSPEIVLHCRAEIETHCSGLHRKGRTLHCLMRIGRDRSSTIDVVCQRALQTLIQSADLGSDYRIDRALNEACESVIQTACKHIRNGDPMILSCLMEHLYTEKMVEECEHRLLELQYFISRDWKLEPSLYKKCQDDAARLCHTHGWNETSELMPPGAVFSCLYRHAYRTEEQGRRVKEEDAVRLASTGPVETSHGGAADPPPEGAGREAGPRAAAKRMTDLGKWCSEKTDTGQVRRLSPAHLPPPTSPSDLLPPPQELECLQDHLEDLVSACREVVANLTEMESEVRPGRQRVGAAASSLNLSLRLCRTSRSTPCWCERASPSSRPTATDVADNQIDTGDLMECLVQNKHQKEMNDKCSVGVTHFQLIQMKDFRFSYKFKMACKEDVLRLCPNIKKKVRRGHLPQHHREERHAAGRQGAAGVAQVPQTAAGGGAGDVGGHPPGAGAVRPLQVGHQPPLPQRGLRQRPDDRVSEGAEEAAEPALPPAHLQAAGGGDERPRAGLPADARLQTDDQGEGRSLASEGGAAPALTCTRLPQRFCSEADARNLLQYYRLNPVLRKACRADIPKFCQNILNKASEDSELEGQVIGCLKLKYADQEVLNMLKESKADIFVDPVLHTACALDLKHHCAAITPGRGRRQEGSLQPECKKRLQDRIDMWEYAAKVAPAEGFSDLAVQVMTSPSKNYILLVMALSVCVLFLVGLLCGRLTKRVTRELKDR
ncbi:unnamed protein product, partial [Tetraodon nigroviridis]